VEEGVPRLRMMQGLPDRGQADAVARKGEVVSFNTRRVIALVVVLLASTVSGWYTWALTASQMAAVLGAVGGAVGGIVVVVLWVSRRS
jgi:hypothetical protein